MLVLLRTKPDFSQEQAVDVVLMDKDSIEGTLNWTLAQAIFMEWETGP